MTTLQLDHNGTLLTGTAEEIAAEILRRNGVTLTDSPGYKYLLVDTVREVEYHAEPAPVDGPRYTVAKDQYFRPCEALTCAVACKARGLHNIRYESPIWEWVEYPSGKQEKVLVHSGHEVEIVQWVVIDRNDPDHMVDAFDTRREARAYAARLEARS